MTLGLHPLDALRPNRIPDDAACAFRANATVSATWTRAAYGAESQSWLLPPANPASTGPCPVKTGTNAAAHTNPINQLNYYGGCVAAHLPRAATMAQAPK